jgi:hypothetical protein
MVFEIYTNNGFIYFVQDKGSEKVECVKKIYENDRNETLSHLWTGEGRSNVLQDKGVPRLL